MGFPMSRRALISGSAVSAAMALSGCKVLDDLTDSNNAVRNVLEKANRLTYHAQRLLLGDNWLAPEYVESDIRQPQRPNGSTSPEDDYYLSLAASGFSGYKLNVGGLVEKPQSFDMDALRAMPARTQITRHDCVEGWSCIAKWTGVPLSTILDAVRPRTTARYVVFRCFDTMERGLSGEVKYYGSIDLVDARHPQTILAYGLNGNPLPIANGAPLRVRVERQLGYKMNKYIRSIELVSEFSKLGLGKGGYWEDRGYDWYAGI